MTSEDVKHITRDTMRSLDLLISADADSEFTFYDDDGHTEDYKRGVFAKTRISVKSGERKTITFTREGGYEDTIERLTIKLISKQKGAFWVSVDGEKLAQYLVRDYWETADSGWYYNLSDRTVWIKFPKPAKASFSVVVSTEKFDLIGMNEE